MDQTPAQFPLSLQFVQRFFHGLLDQTPAQFPTSLQFVQRFCNAIEPIRSTSMSDPDPCAAFKRTICCKERHSRSPLIQLQPWVQDSRPVPKLPFSLPWISTHPPSSKFKPCLCKWWQLKNWRGPFSAFQSSYPSNCSQPCFQSPVHFSCLCVGGQEPSPRQSLPVPPLGHLTEHCPHCPLPQSHLHPWHPVCTHQKEWATWWMGADVCWNNNCTNEKRAFCAGFLH